VAIPNYARMNRLDHPPLEFPGDDRPVNYAPGATAGSAPATSTTGTRPFRSPTVISQVWMKNQA
jgi:hypothetical protein